LQHPERIDRGAEDSEYTHKLLSWLSVALKPIGDILIQENGSDSHKLLERLILTSSVAFKCIRHLQAHSIPHGEQLDPNVLLSTIAYTDLEDPWTTETLREEAEQVLSCHKKQLTSNEFIVNHVLLGFIRPLFSESQPSSVTSQGRKAINQTVRKPDHLRDLDASKKPWKFREVSTMAVLRWSIQNMDVSILTRKSVDTADKILQDNMIHKNWHLCIPPLLTLLDDPSTVVRVRGLHILREMLGRIPPNVLQQAGLGEVFEDAVIPTLLFLPTLTPVEESLSLLKNDRSDRLKFLDRVMRQGVLQGFMHSGENVKIAELLVNEATTLFENMGIHAVKYLKVGHDSSSAAV
jgi:hypothetical protein